MSESDFEEDFRDRLNQICDKSPKVEERYDRAALLPLFLTITSSDAADELPEEAVNEMEELLSNGPLTRKAFRAMIISKAYASDPTGVMLARIEGRDWQAVMEDEEIESD